MQLLKDFIRNLTLPLHEEVYDSLSSCRNENAFLNNRLVEKDKEVQDLSERNETLINESCFLEYKSNKIPEIDLFLSTKYAETVCPAYTQKRSINGAYYSVLLQQFIQPEQFEVQKLRNKLELTSDVFSNARLIGDWVARNITWTDDKNLAKSGDYYLYPEETIALKKADCEDHAYLVASLDPNIGIAYGFFEDGDNRYGHAWNVIVEDTNLYNIETTGNTVEITLAETDRRYQCYFIVTKNGFYRLKGGVEFGYVASWD